jgi:hypothetical protein
MLIYFLKKAASMHYSQIHGPISTVLFLLAGFWLVRGFFDSLYREHYLEMQAMLLIYLYGVIVSRDRASH